MGLGNMRVLCQTGRQGQVVEIDSRSHLHYHHVRVRDLERPSVYFDVSVNIWTLERGIWAGDGEIGRVMGRVKNLRGTLGKV